MPSRNLFFILITMAISWSLSFANSPSLADTAEQANRKALYKGQLLLLNEHIKEKPTLAAADFAAANAAGYAPGKFFDEPAN